ncbi:MAG: hypothetical protein EPN93_11780 [Spirochaetes bacterium]|nr:MAG: hypothetical protein EPN93_11780 [Spirochaetota bacterium]
MISIKRISLLFASGAVGGLCNALVIWAFGALGITMAMGVHIVPPLSPPFLYAKVVWGGIWGLALLLPLFPGRLALRAFVLSLLPSIVQLVVVFPMKDAHMLGLALGGLTPLFVIFFNFTWGLAAVYWYHACGDR